MKQPFNGYFRISQKFGENLNGYYKAEGMLGHNGIDFAMPNGTPIISPVDGIVTGLSTDIHSGEGVSVMSDTIFQWNGQDCKFICIHWHFQDGSVKLKVGDRVKVGDLLGLSNNTGQSTGPHLHFSLIPIATDGSRRNLAGLNNGYKGCIDPLPYLELELPPVSQKEIKMKELQTLLNKYGANLVVDGKFGKLSSAALDKFLQ